MTTSRTLPHLYFGSPRALPKATSLAGRVVVLDIAFAATVSKKISFDAITKPFLTGLGDRLACWIDHHDHERHVEFANDERFILSTKAQHGACPEMVTPERVHRAGPIDTILTHVDLDGLYAAAKWILDGREPYKGADDDARAIDTRIGTPGPIALRIDHAVRARFRDDQLKRAIVHWLVDGMAKGPHNDIIEEAAAEFAARAAGTAQIASRYVIRGRCAVVDTDGGKVAFDKTDLLLAGQTRAPISVVRDVGTLTIAAPFHSGWDFVALLGLGGGMPTRVSVPDANADDVIARLNAAPEPTPKTVAGDDSE